MPIKKRDFWIAQSTKRFSFFSAYELQNEIGRGPNSIVYKCQRKGLDLFWSVKILTKNINKQVPLANAVVLLGLDHKNLVRLQEIFETRTRIYVVQELITGEGLFERITNPNSPAYTEGVISKAVRDVVNGLKYLHFCDYVVKNLKPENLLYANPSSEAPLKIADFAMSTIVGPEVHLSSLCKFPSFTAPEIMKGSPCGKPGDLWALGVITFILLFGVEPFAYEDPLLLFKNVIKGQYEFPSRGEEDISSGAKDFLRKILVVEPAKRLTIEAAYRNCWVNSVTCKHAVLDNVVLNIIDYNNRRRQQLYQPPLPISTIHSDDNPHYILLVEPAPERTEEEVRESNIELTPEQDAEDPEKPGEVGEETSDVNMFKEDPGQLSPPVLA